MRGGELQAVAANAEIAMPVPVEPLCAEAGD
jgi:hypothetical protein